MNNDQGVILLVGEKGHSRAMPSKSRNALSSRHSFTSRQGGNKSFWRIWTSWLLFFTILGCCVGAQANGTPQTVNLNSDEQAWLNANPVVFMCVDPDWAPFERINAQGQHEGIAADLIQTVAERVNLRIELYPTRSWDESLEASKAGHCQILSFLNQTTARDEWLIFTAPIFFDPNIIIAREERSYIADLSGLSDTTVALPRGTMVEERIRRSYPNLTPILTNSEQEAVTLVSERKADITIRSLIVAADAIKKAGLFNLKIAGHVPDFANELRIGVAEELPLLRSILDKGVRTLTPQERVAISNRHVAVQIKQGIDYGVAWKVLLALLAVILVVLYWNKSLHSLNQKLERLSVTDRLTGLYNRLKLDQVLANEILRSARSTHPFSVILLDIDKFKQVNDQFGHQAGDQVLASVARLMLRSIRKTDVLGRWGGEEFLIVCPHTDAAGALRLAENLRLAVQGYQFDQIGTRTASFGVATYTAGDTADKIVQRADAALYAAKAAGRNRVEAAG